MDELEKKAQRGLDSYSESGDLRSVKTELDGLVDDMLGEDDDASINKETAKKNSWIYIVLVILGLAILSYFGYKDGSNKEDIAEGPVLYAQYFEVLPDMLTANERSSEKEDEEQQEAVQGMREYNSGNYKGAAALLKNSEDVIHQIYAAIAEMENRNFSDAIDLLNQCQKNDTNGKYTDITDWYLALSHIKNGNLKQGKLKLNSIISTDKHYKKKEAEKILKALE